MVCRGGFWLPHVSQSGGTENQPNEVRLVGPVVSREAVTWMLCQDDSYHEIEKGVLVLVHCGGRYFSTRTLEDAMGIILLVQ